MYTFRICCGGPHYGLADIHCILQIRETGFTSRAPLVAFKAGDFKIKKKQLANRGLDQN
jgi:hypothetical protein